MKTSRQGQWCIFYCKLSDMNTWNTMKLRRSDGVIVSAKTYDDVFTFYYYKDAWDFVKKLITEEPTPKYDATVRKINHARKNSFYLSGS